ncbi:MAG: DUF4398 domain-containing protein [Myxococcales bacterium]|nr:DUF4398 domain-containing protein [Myxococcales bacterium]
MQFRQVGVLLATLGSVTLLPACAGSQPPTNDLTQAKATIRAAEEVGADGAPSASVYLKLARDGASRAERLMEDDENETARMVLARAEMDAQVALELARTANERGEAQEAWKKVEELKEDN